MGEASRTGRRPGNAWIAVALAFATGCGSTLVDHNASPALVAPVCAPGKVACDGQCLTCSPPSNAAAVCEAGGCGFACDPGFNRCSPDACTAESGTSCGAACTDCTASAPANAAPACSSAHTCDFQCNPGFLRDGGQCVRAVAVSAGYDHACALTATGTVECWGANDSGQLGDGSATDRAAPVAVSLPAPASQVASGYSHTCALAAGRVYCWGDNAFGEIGDGTTTGRRLPVLVDGLPEIAFVGAGGAGLTSVSAAHTCAIATTGSTYCWGSNGSGQLGNGGTAPGLRPALVSALGPGVRPDRVACGGRHTCALAGGAVQCFGANDSGQLGIGSTNAQSVPAFPAVASGATVLATGENHTCALVGGLLLCWGLDTSGQVDAGNTAAGAFTSPHAPPLPLFSPTAVAGGRAYTCALDGASSPADLRCFGANPHGELGGAGSLTHVALVAPRTATDVTTGGDHTCALTTEGGVQCWGLNDHGQLGRGTFGGESPDPGYVVGR
jgi:alpha-tubulin suppressor-like RCC1 family protein